MAVAGSAVGIASLGIEICGGLLSYYDGWKGYNSDISSACDAITDLSRTLTVLKAFLDSEELDEEKRERVKRCIQSCEDGLVKLSKKLHKLRKHGEPEGFQQKACSGIQRAWYPFRSSTLEKLREIVDDARERLKLAIQVLQLDASTSTQRTLAQVAADASETVTRTVAIEAQNQRVLAIQQSDQFRKICSWISPPDPGTNHLSARQRHEPHTGTWLLQSAQYQSWKSGSARHLWVHGKAGCGKTVLCSTAIEDVRTYCESATNAGHAMFYFSFSDKQKQSHEHLLRSLAVQVGWKEPGRSMLQQAYDKPNRSTLGADELEKIVLSSIESYDEMFVLLDALDECPEDGEVRLNVLECLERLSRKAPKLRIFATSREMSDIGESMEMLGAVSMSTEKQSVDTDIRRYMSGQLSRDRKLRRLDSATKALIEGTISRSADGMFRWAYCQLQELKMLPSTKPKYIKETLRSLPLTLDATYERMLVGIKQMFRQEALILLCWLAYAESPPSLGELASAAIIDPTAEGCVAVDERGGLEDTLNILSGLVVIQGVDTDDNNDNDDSDRNEDSGSDSSDCEDCSVSVVRHRRRISKDTKVRLAHHSVKEYLESKRILQSEAKDFYLESAASHRFLAQSCLTYLQSYSRSSEKSSTEHDLVIFPLLQYAARSWVHHSSLQQLGDTGREVSLLSSEDALQDWLLVYQPDRLWTRRFKSLEDTGRGLYYASFAGLEAAVNNLLRFGAEVNAQGGEYGNALQAASERGHSKVLQILMDAGADVNAQGGFYGNALQAALGGGHSKVMQMLIDAGADVNAQGGFYGNALQAALGGGHSKVVQMLIDAGADVNAQVGGYGNALQAASERGYEKMVQILIDAGADVNAQGGFYGNALQAALGGGHSKVVQILIDAGADVNAQGGLYDNALQAASERGYEKMVQILIDARADVNAQGGSYGNALQAASLGGHSKVVQMLIAAGADVNAQGGDYSNALQAASREGHSKVVQMLMDAGADSKILLI